MDSVSVQDRHPTPSTSHSVALAPRKRGLVLGRQRSYAAPDSHTHCLYPALGKVDVDFFVHDLVAEEAVRPHTLFRR